MPDNYTECLCAKCARKPALLRRIKKATVRKHMQKHGPVAPIIRNTSLVPDEQGRGEHRDEAEGVMLRRDGEEMDMDLGGPGLGFGFDEDDDNVGPPLESQAGSNQIQQPDAHYTPISIPGNVYPPIDSHSDSVVAPLLRDNDPSFL
uniref:Uncharacterized protein n=1 Tax=Moniliophthora roreri TaxID=221103 RepID=A0A0W0FW98_MONRR